MTSQRLVNHRQLAAMLGESPRLVRKWMRDGHLPAPHTTLARTHYYLAEDVERFIKTGSWYKERGPS
jgi:predicted DNA-binding transcriptional regulator AlpA